MSSSRSSNNNTHKKTGNNKRKKGEDDDSSLSLLLLQQPRQTTRRQKKLAVNAQKSQVFEIILAGKKYLHWRDAMALGAGTCKDVRTMWKHEYESAYLTPLLEILEGMVGPGDDEDNWEDNLRSLVLPEDYDKLPLVKKCGIMTNALEMFVGNMQNHRSTTYSSSFDLDDPSNREENAKCDVRGWCMGGGYEHVTDFLHEHDRRGTLAVNIAIFSFALSAMEQGGDYYFNDVFLGVENAILGGGSWYDRTICHSLSRMLPLRDEDLIKCLRCNYPSLEELSILGPLVPKVVLMAPFFRWVPPDENEGDKLDELPTSLEEMNEVIIREHGMEEFLEPHYGIDYS